MKKTKQLRKLDNNKLRLNSNNRKNNTNNNQNNYKSHKLKLCNKDRIKYKPSAKNIYNSKKPKNKENYNNSNKIKKILRILNILFQQVEKYLKKKEINKLMKSEKHMKQN